MANTMPISIGLPCAASLVSSTMNTKTKKAPFKKTKPLNATPRSRSMGFTAAQVQQAIQSHTLPTPHSQPFRAPKLGEPVRPRIHTAPAVQLEFYAPSIQQKAVRVQQLPNDTEDCWDDDFEGMGSIPAHLQQVQQVLMDHRLIFKKFALHMEDMKLLLHQTKQLKEKSKPVSLDHFEHDFELIDALIEFADTVDESHLPKEPSEKMEKLLQTLFPENPTHTLVNDTESLDLEENWDQGWDPVQLPSKNRFIMDERALEQLIEKTLQLKTRLRECISFIQSCA